MLDTIKSNAEISRIFSSKRRYSNQFATFVVAEDKEIEHGGESLGRTRPSRSCCFYCGEKARECRLEELGEEAHEGNL